MGGRAQHTQRPGGRRWHQPAGTADPTARTWEAEQGLGRVAAPGLWFDEQRRHAHRLRGIRGRSPDTGTAVEQRFLGRQIQLVDQPVQSRRTAIDPQQPLERAELTVERARVARQRRSQTHITALGNLPNAVIGEPVTSSVGHGVFSGIVGPLRLAFLLLEAGQFLYLIRLCALAGSVAAFCLGIVQLGLRSRGGFLLGLGNRGLLLALDRFGRLLKPGCQFVGLLLRGGGTLLRSLFCGALPLFGSCARFLDFTLCHRARVFLVLDRLVALGLQLVVSLLLVLGRSRVELGRPAQRITALDERATAPASSTRTIRSSCRPGGAVLASPANTGHHLPQLTYPASKGG